MAPIIEVRNLSKRFGNLLAVDDCSMSVEEGAITGLIGPNGAGKTTLFNMVAGVFPPSHGRIMLAGDDVTGLASHDLYHRGLLRTFQIAHEFSHLTALENLMVVPAGQSGENLFSAWLRPGRVSSQEVEVRRKAADVIGFLGLDHVRNEPAGNLSGGQKKLLELGRVMMAEPRVVLLDEIAAGVNRTLLQSVVAAIERLNQERGLTFFVIEHDMDMIARLCDPVIVMAAGSVMMQGSMDEIRNNPQVIEAYFGGAPQQEAQA
jgi:branched-chain amino acid transport system ATP-binding protein